MPLPSMHDDPTQLPGGRALALLAALCLAVYLPSAASAEFLNFDDPRLFGPGSELARAGLAGILDPRATIADAYLPVAHLSLWLDRLVFGDRPFGPHLHSLVLHVLVAFAVARLAARLGLSPRAATAAAAVFALHPALAESVLWVASRKDLLSGLFAVLALSALCRHLRGGLPTRGAVLRIAGFGLLAVYAKGSAVVLPALAVPVVLLLAGRAGLRAHLPVLAAATLPALLGAVHHAAIAASVGAMGGGPAVGALERLAQVPGAFLHYLTTAVWPAGLNVLYPEVDTLDAFRAALLPGLLALGAQVAAIAVLARRAPRVAAGLALWLGALLPFNTAFPATSIAAADRYLYLALPGLAFALAALPRLGVGLAVAAAVALGLGARARAGAFEASEPLWRASLATAPHNAAAQINLALAVLDPDPLGQPLVGVKTFAIDGLAEAEALLEDACETARYPIHRVRAASALVELARASRRLERAARFGTVAARAADGLDPADPVALAYRVQLHLDASRLCRIDGDDEAARAHAEAARALAPGHPYVLSFDAALLLADAIDPATGKVAPDDPRRAAAQDLLDRAAALDPQLYELHWARGEWARATGQLLAAEKSFRDAIEVDPARPEAWLARVDLFLARAGMADSAAKIARQGVAATGDPALRFRLALALTAAEQIEEARQHYEAYLALRPNDPEARAGLASVLAAIGMRQLYQATPEVLDRLAVRILELDPTHPKPRLMQAVAARARHDLVAALVLLESVREQMPDDPEVEQLYAESLRDRGWQLRLHEDRHDAAIDHFVRFLAVAPPSIPTEAVRNLVEQEWRRQVEAGRDALTVGEASAAEQAYRRALELRPDAERAALDYFLGLALFQGTTDGDPRRLEEALACFERAEAAQRDGAGRDRGLAVLYQVRTLLRLGELERAAARGEALLAEPGTTDADVLERIRDAIER